MFNKNNIPEMKRQYEAGVRAATIAHNFGLSKTYVYALLRKAGVDTSASYSKPKFLNEEEKIELLEDYNHGMLTNALSEKYGVHAVTVRRILKGAGVSFGHCADPKERLAVIRKMYECGIKVGTIAKAYDTSREYVHAILKKAGVKTRSPHRAWLTDDEKQGILMDYKNEMSLDEISEKYNARVTTVRCVLKTLGVSFKSYSIERKADEICRLYGQGDSSYTISAKMGIPPYAVTKVLKAQGVAIRHKGWGEVKRPHET